MPRTPAPKASDDAIIIEALRTFASVADDGAPRHRHTAHGRELRRRAARARQLAHAYEVSIPAGGSPPRRRVDQTILADPEAGVIGNCWQAAVATLLGLPLTDVPHFAEADDPDYIWRAWLADRRLMSIELPLLSVPPDLPCLLVGTSPRGIAHVIVATGLTMVHDPHPPREGLAVTRHAWAIAPYLPPLGP